MKVVSEIGSSVEYPSVFWILCTVDCGWEFFFCFLSWRLIPMTKEVSESDMLLTFFTFLQRRILRFSFRKIGDNCRAEGVDCDADVPATLGCVGGAAIGSGGLKCNICVKSGRF